MKHYLYMLFVLLFLGSVSAATWVANPTLCPNTYQSQTCSGSDLVCGYNGGVTFCYNNAILTAPVANAQTSTDQDSGSLNGGYIVDCTSYDGSSPYCDNAGSYYCDRNSTCYNVNRLTNCTGGSFATSVCDTCRSGYTYCDASYTDGDGCEVQSGVTNCAVGSNNNLNSGCTCVCDSGYLDCDAGGAGVGNGCEVQNGGACTSGGLPGTYSGCTCVVSQQHFITGVQANYSHDTQWLLWGQMFGLGGLFNLTNATHKSFWMGQDLCFHFPDGTSQCTAPLTYPTFNQALNTTSNVTFNNVTINGQLGWVGLQNYNETAYCSNINTSNNLRQTLGYNNTQIAGQNITSGVISAPINTTSNMVVYQKNLTITNTTTGRANFYWNSSGYFVLEIF